MEVCQFSTAVSPMEEHRYRKEPGWMDAMKSRAADALAQFILRNETALFRRIEPTRAELERNPFANIKYRWSIGLQTDLDEIKARERQMEVARQQGRAEAATLCLDAAARYQRLSGGCAGVIASALSDAARAIQQSENGA